MRRFLQLCLCLCLPAGLPAAVTWRQVLQQPAAWYGTAEARAVAENVLLYQSPEGGWAKNRDMTLPPAANRESEEAPEPTIDNGATITQLRLLARVHLAQPDPRWQSALERGIDYLLAAQYDNGGWPQFYPLIRGYYSHITFNDDAMVNVLGLLQEIAQHRPPFTSIDAGRRDRAARAIELGIACILRCQIVVNGLKTAWCAQHDEHTLAPAPARRYEHASLSGRESLGILRFLMSLENPSPDVVAAVHAAAAWFESAKMTGVREDHPPNPAARHGHDRVLVQDPSAPPLWARFYEIGTNRPIYGGRDGVIRYDLAEVEFERRGGYMWHTPEPRRFLEKEYPAWARRWPAAGAATVPKPAVRPAAAPAKADVIVAADGSGDFTSVQEAISRAPMRTGLNDPRWVIHVRPGIYRERIHVQRERGNILVRGEDAVSTVIVFNLHANTVGEDGRPIGTSRTPTVWIDGDGMIWANLTLANDAGPVGQALALRADGDRLVFRQVRFLGWQDTILVNRGRHYFEDCYIEGHVDFIFGAATAFFARCHIHCLRDGYITAASTPEGTPHGYVFADSRITGSAGVQTYLGRPWRNFARTVFLRTAMTAVVRPVGWHNWNKPDAEQTTFYAEFGSTGPGANDSARVPWAKPLDAAQAAALTPQAVLGGADGWDPVHFQ